VFVADGARLKRGSVAVAGAAVNSADAFCAANRKKRLPGSPLYSPRLRQAQSALQIWNAMAALTHSELEQLRSAFNACDSNSDGFIDREEFHRLLKLLDADTSAEECLLDFEATDTEGDGFIGFKEFVAWWTG
jgi:hypothetical protein